MKILLAALTLLTAMTASAAHHGDVITNKQGMSLYTFDKDKNGKSACYDGCAAKWPPYIAASSAKAKAPWGLVERKDGAMQWTYSGQPLYLWVGDQQKGDATGDGIGGVWHTAKKAPVKKKTSSYSGY
jgi:predicted lipoprotein with Yx(FWY)xxD motif